MLLCFMTQALIYIYIYTNYCTKSNLFVSSNTTHFFSYLVSTRVVDIHSNTQCDQVQKSTMSLKLRLVIARCLPIC